jgi:tetratricopeptide (TPR) repeat protein
MEEIIQIQRDAHSSLTRFIFNNWRWLAGLAVAAILGAGVYAYSSHLARQAKLNAENGLGTIIASKTGDERLQALDEFLKTAPSSMKGAVLLEIARTSQDQGDYKRAAQAWNELSLVATEGMRTLASLGQSTALARSGDRETAIKQLKDLLGSSPTTFQPIIAQELAAVAEEAKMYPEAVQAYQKLLETSTGRNKAYYEMKLATTKALIK